MPFKFSLLTTQPAEEYAGTRDNRKSRRRSLLSSLKVSKWKRRERIDQKLGQKITAAIAVDTYNCKTDNVEAARNSRDSSNSEQAVDVINERKGLEHTDGESPEAKQQPILNELSEDEVHGLFSGAPQFSIEQKYGLPRPTASFPWDLSLIVRDVSDCPPLEHPAFSSATLQRHFSSAAKDNKGKTSLVEHDIGVVELPSMLGARGNERGTVGFEHFLQESIADFVTFGQDKSEGDDEFTGIQNHELLESNPERLGLRKFDLENIADRLAELSNMYIDCRESLTEPTLLKRQTPSELYALLFGKFLTPPKFDATTEDPTGLKVQIEALTKALSIQAVWFDFSSVEWRIRVGQMLWTEANDPDLLDDATESYDELSERNVLLFQLLLACELLVRLDAIANLSTPQAKEALHLTTDEIVGFRRVENRKTRWDLVLARRFLENVEAKCVITSKEVSTPQPISRRDFFYSSVQQAAAARSDQVDILCLPRKPEQQQAGLFHFARTISWPDADEFESNLTERLRSNEDAFSIPSPSIYTTPMSGTPRSFSSNRSSDYFDSRPLFSRSTTQRSLQLQPASASVGIPSLSPDGFAPIAESSPASKTLIGGWLTRTYLTGLIMPGEPICHFLISALLENDALAIAALGDCANLYGGFVYNGRSWWSNSSIVGRVLACLEGATECMGWICVPCIPTGFEEGWVDVKSRIVNICQVPRIADGEGVKVDSDFLAGNTLGDVKSIDLVLPSDAKLRPTSSILFGGLRLEMVTNHDSTEDLARSFSASVTILSSSLSNEIGNPSISLEYLVQFVSSYPCTTPPAGKVLQVRPIDGDGTAVNGLPAHPLHISQAYKIISAAAILGTNFSLPTTADKDILILDARGDNVLELLARAWCSSKGEHALISRVGVTCLACSVREARALDLKFVIRIE